MNPTPLTPPIDNDNKQISTSSVTPTTLANHNCANLIEADHDNNEIQQHQQKSGKGTTARAPVPQQYNEVTHQATHPATRNYATHIENNPPSIHTTKDQLITKYNDQIVKQ